MLLLSVSEAPTEAELRAVSLTARALRPPSTPPPLSMPRARAAHCDSSATDNAMRAHVQDDCCTSTHAGTRCGVCLFAWDWAASRSRIAPSHRHLPHALSRALPPALVIPALLSGIGRRGGDCGQPTSGTERAGATHGCATALTRRPRRLPLLCAEGAATAATERGHGRRSQQQPRASQSSLPRWLCADFDLSASAKGTAAAAALFRCSAALPPPPAARRLNVAAAVSDGTPSGGVR
jgi:hypothetical protein